MKKIVKLSLTILLIIVCLTGSVYASPNCNISMETTKKEYDIKDDEIIIDVKISNIKSSVGIIAIQAVLEYDKESLTLEKMEGQNDWKSPVKNASYNEEKGILVMDKDGLAKSDEEILKLTFKINKKTKKNLMVELKDVKISDGTKLAVIGSTYKSITIKDGEENQPPTPPDDPNKPENPDNPSNPEEPSNPSNPEKPSNPSNPENPENPDNSNPTQNQDSSTNEKPELKKVNQKDNIANGKLPQTGLNKTILKISIVLAIIVGIIFYIRIKKVNKKIRRR